MAKYMTVLRLEHETSQSSGMVLAGRRLGRLGECGC